MAKKLQSFKNKEDNAKKERVALRDIIKKHQKEMKDEKKKYKRLKKEVRIIAIVFLYDIVLLLIVFNICFNLIGR